MLLVAGGPNLRTACNIAQECGIHMVPHTNTLIKVFSEPGKYVVADYIRDLQGLDARRGDELLLVLSNPVTEHEVMVEERATARGLKVQLINGPADRRRQQVLRQKHRDMQEAAEFFKQYSAQAIHGSHASANAQDAARKLEIEMRRMQIQKQMVEQNARDRVDARKAAAERQRLREETAVLMDKIIVQAVAEGRIKPDKL